LLQQESWIASSQGLLAMTLREFDLNFKQRMRVRMDGHADWPINVIASAAKQ
jgi:hypothetical protein